MYAALAATSSGPMSTIRLHALAALDPALAADHCV